ncbi:MAG TPA: addiction module protein [Edaphocola sp.]|nr:addiction module protein [Edaphocola sp.]
MSLQYISDSKGNTTGVYIPINEWNALKSKYKGIEDEATDTVPDWHKDIVLNRLANYKKDKTQALDFDKAMDDIETVL